jgi:hypothetical protein
MVIKANKRIKAGLIYRASVTLKDRRIEHEKESLESEFDAKLRLPETLLPEGRIC